jgi:hypothetical protein
MKKHLLTAFIVLVTLAVMLGFFEYAWYRKEMWKLDALSTAEFAAKLWAANDYSKGKRIQLRLVVREDPFARSQPKATQFEGQYVIRDWVGYTDPLFKNKDSPSIQVASKMVDVYNAAMKEMVENPTEYQKRLAREIDYWQTNVLGRTAGSNRASEVTTRKLVVPQR